MPELDHYGRMKYSLKEILKLLYINPNLDLGKFEVDTPSTYNSSNELFKTGYPKLNPFNNLLCDLDEFDADNQKNWNMPDEYKNLDIAQWLLYQCKNEEELQRVGKELLLYQDRDLFNLLRFLKYMVDVMRKNKIVWGVGRGSSVASFVLYLIGIHKINSITYQIPIEEFLR
jgi:hypothetical protein